jgi:hypothetical protein
VVWCRATCREGGAPVHWQWRKVISELIYCLIAEGPESAAVKFLALRSRVSETVLLDEALVILSNDFASDDLTEGSRKNGPVSYARFLTDPGAPDRNVRHQRDASGVVEAFVEAVHRASA